MFLIHPACRAQVEKLHMDGDGDDSCPVHWDLQWYKPGAGGAQKGFVPMGTTEVHYPVQPETLVGHVEKLLGQGNKTDGHALPKRGVAQALSVIRSSAAVPKCHACGEACIRGCATHPTVQCGSCNTEWHTKCLAAEDAQRAQDRASLRRAWWCGTCEERIPAGPIPGA
jgi:hypothetical protein